MTSTSSSGGGGVVVDEGGKEGAAAAPPDALQVALSSPHAGFGASGPACWGPLQWMAMHQLVRGYPRDNPTQAQKEALVTYMTSLAEIMPCSLCADHWRAIAPTVAGATSNRYSALKWTIDVHNAVNARLGKPVLTYGQAVAAIQNACPNNVLGCTWNQRCRTSVEQAKQCSANDRTAFLACLIVSIVVIVALVIAIIVMATPRMKGTSVLR